MKQHCHRCGRIVGRKLHRCYFLSAADIVSKFWEQVVKTDSCWLWTGAASKYGRIYVGGGRGKYKPGVHRYSWELHNGPIPEGMMVLHHCDNPKCVNPSHLFLGTAKDNSVDMASKGRAYLQKAPRSVQIQSAAHMREMRGW